MKKIIVLTGATASGKTTTAIKLAKKLKTSIICADSRIIYKDLDIVSAKPTLEEQSGIKHHLIDIISPEIEFSAGDFVLKAQEVINSINEEYIIISGGTWFYIKSLLDEKALPECPINQELRDELEKKDNQLLWEKLKELDFKRAQEIHPNNKDKVIRSIEMCTFLNSPISEYQRKDNKTYDASWFMMDLCREELYERINLRVDLMFELGLENEWRKNKEKYPTSKIIQNTIGYKEFFELEEGIYKDISGAKEKIKQHTRNFAKRQLTYFRSNPEIKLIKNEDEIINIIKKGG
ncbi:MAG: tRNA (adenosine(37)-N6)-dimethylallyltransferase MiaA [Candidatus Gastranaerophilales bacterium]|nr:tRNA (adenosine(37)-N6)-dimethylallyltransferase MiaA [Candidatus Gastranaerophilales bacterium]